MLNWRTKRGVLAARKDPLQEARDARARQRLVSFVAHDESLSHYRVLWEHIKTGLAAFYLVVVAGILSSAWDYGRQDFLWYMFGTRAFWADAFTALVWASAVALFVALAYFIGGSVHHESHAADWRKSRKSPAPRMPMPPHLRKRLREVAEQKSIEMSRMRREAFHNMQAGQPF